MARLMTPDQRTALIDKILRATESHEPGQESRSYAFYLLETGLSPLADAINPDQARTLVNDPHLGRIDQDVTARLALASEIVPLTATK